MENSMKTKSVFHALVLLLLCVGMLAGYYWMPLVGFILEIAFWIYGGITINNEAKAESSKTDMQTAVSEKK